MKFISKSFSDTLRIARKIKLNPGDVILLRGSLGAGKTAFAKGLLSGLGFDKDKVISSSFVLISHYENNRVSVFHIDLYRLTRRQVIDFVDFWEILNDSRSIKIIEWPEAAEGILPKGSIEVHIEYKNQAERIITISNCKRR